MTLLRFNAPSKEKSLVFSQWTGVLDKVEIALKEAGIIACRLDGTMKEERRRAVLKLFSIPLSHDGDNNLRPDVDAKHHIPAVQGRKGKGRAQAVSPEGGVLDSSEIPQVMLISLRVRE